MEPIALQVKAPQFDALGAVKQGMELANLGIQPLRLAQELRQAQIDEQEAARALEMKRYEDTARKTAGEVLRRHTKDGKTDHKAALSEMRTLGLDPKFTEELETKVLANQATQLKTGTDALNTLTEYTNGALLASRGMNPQQRAGFLQSRMTMASRQLGIPMELIQDHFGKTIGLDEPGLSPQQVEARISAYTDAISITPQEERELRGRGLGPQAFQAGSEQTQALKAWLASRGIQLPASMDYATAKNDPRFATQIAAYEKEVTGAIPGEGTRVAGIEAAAEAQAARGVYQDALSLRGKYNRAITRAGTTLQDLFERFVTQTAERARIQGAIDDYNVRNPNAQITLRDGAQAVFARLAQQDTKLRALQESGAAIGATGNLRQTAEGKVTPEQQRARDSEAVTILQSEYDAKVDALKKMPNNRRLEADVDALARELKAKGVSVPLGADVLRGAKREEPKNAVPKGQVMIRFKNSGRERAVPEANAWRLIKAGRAERI